MSSRRPEVVEYFQNRLGDMISATEHLVAAESPSSDIPALNRCARELVQYITEMTGLMPALLHAGKESRPHLRLDLGARTDVLLVGHFDTVYPVGTLADHPTHREGERLYGIGAVDMKGGLVIMAEVARWLQHNLPHVNVTMFFNSDEEIGSITSGPLLRQIAAQANVVLSFDTADPTGAIKHAARGVRQIEVTVHGKGGHAAYPEFNANPVDALGDVIASARRYHRPEKGLVVVPTRVQGSDVVNAVPDSATVCFDVRASTNEQLDMAQKGIERIKFEDPRFRVNVRVIASIPTFELRDDNYAIELARYAAKEVGFSELKFIEARGASDANQVASVSKHILADMGPYGGGAHSAGREFLHTTSLVRHSTLAALMCERVLLECLDMELTGPAEAAG